MAASPSLDKALRQLPLLTIDRDQKVNIMLHETQRCAVCYRQKDDDAIRLMTFHGE